MKFGVLYNKSNQNLGDDIQAYAASLFYPQIDCVVNREGLPAFRPDDGKPVAVIMSAWFMWKKWNWPPSPYVYPLFVGFHYADHQLSDQPGSPIKYEYLTGEGAEYLKAYGPIGARDIHTVERLRKNGIDAYFSGCITLTLPKQKREDRGRYICLVDVDRRVVKKIRKDMEGSGIEVREYTHTKKRDRKAGAVEREAEVVERLTEYQNAVCVVTKKLHCALPCLAMEVPVLLVKDMADDIRFTPYYDFLHWVRPKDFLSGKCGYDLTDPPENKPDYKPYREQLIKTCREFVDSVKDRDLSREDICRYREDPKKVLRWRIETTEKVLPMWIEELEKTARECSDLQKENWKLMKQTGEYREKYSFTRRMKHIYYNLRDSTYRNLLPDMEAEITKIEEKLTGEFGGRPEGGIEELRFMDKRCRRIANRLTYFSKQQFITLKEYKKENKRLRKALKSLQ
ncbi:MAG: polysaccharide pyruvyl transferase family protein [Candidatus Weimeria sp.]